ncbi:hypothetical protein HD596_012027 [Nonomuraea jabiensis]|uniref:Uncharacterized protein n=1 Tax=Nonomuraea jabiensis TaxID=882448 RepID=A0A7W9GKJ6_9ACTN|nr:hypothetical protein [Nonomuraea jabiensis]
MINRKDFGITYNAVLETGGVMISEQVTLEFDLSAVKAAADLQGHFRQAVTAWRLRSSP